MAVIGTRTFVLDGVKPYVTLGSEEFVRPLGIGNVWTKIRIALLVSVVPSGTNNIANGGLIVGVCSGTSAPYGSPTTTNFAGVSFATVGVTLTTYSYIANAGYPGYTIGYPNIVTRVGSSTTVGAGSTYSAPYFTAAGVGTLVRRGILCVDIQKGSPNYALNWPSAWSAISADYSMSHLMELCEAGSVNGTAVALNGYTGAVSEAAGAFDSLNIFWPRSTNPVEIYAIAVARLS